jgi:uncharacterized protein
MALAPKLVSLAKSGDFQAQCRVAQKLMASETPSSYREAAPWLRKIARHPDRIRSYIKGWAEYHLGLIYNHGYGAPRNIGVAMKWYEQAVSYGHDSAQLNLGILLANLPGRRRNLARAVKLYRQAARSGRRNAAYNLGLYYSEGRGVPKDLRMARRWYQQAADLGDRDARRIVRSMAETPNHSSDADAGKRSRSSRSGGRAGQRKR